MTPFTSKLEQKTRELLKNRSRELSYEAISTEATQRGGDISKHWLTSFMTTPNTGFSVQKVELLYCILTGTELEL